MGAVLTIVGLALLVVEVLLVARGVLDWSVVLAGPSVAGSLRSRLSQVVRVATEPVLAPVRRVVPPVRMGTVSVDLAFIVVFVAVVVLRGLIG